LTLYFKNKPRKVISRDARSFSIGLNIIKDKEVINDNDSEYILIWRSNNFRLPSEINYPEDLDITKGSDYLIKFWRKLRDYIDSTSTVDLPITTGKNILIFVNLEGLNGIYIPHQIAFSNSGKVLYGIQYDAEFYRATFSLLPFGKWIFHMVYHINKRAASKGNKFELNIQDRNNIKIKKV
jgi:hypothetical protein